MGEIEDCALTDELEWHVVGMYHTDCETHGPVSGLDGNQPSGTVCFYIQERGIKIPFKTIYPFWDLCPVLNNICMDYLGLDNAPSLNT